MSFHGGAATNMTDGFRLVLMDEIIDSFHNSLTLSLNSFSSIYNNQKNYYLALKN